MRSFETYKPKPNSNAASSHTPLRRNPNARTTEEIRRDRELRTRRLENIRRADEIRAARRADGAMERENVAHAQPNNEDDLGAPRPNDQLGQGLNRAMPGMDEPFRFGMDEDFRAMAAQMEAIRRVALAVGAPRNNERPRRGAQDDRNVVNGETLQNGDVDVNNAERSEESNSRAEGEPVVAASGNPPGLNN